MANLKGVLQQLRDERRAAEAQIQKLRLAISVLDDLVGQDGSMRSHRETRQVRVVSATARRRMAAAQRARWAKVRKRGQTANRNKARAVPTTNRHTLSAVARRKIAAAQKARWAKFRAQRSKKSA